MITPMVMLIVTSVYTICAGVFILWLNEKILILRERLNESDCKIACLIDARNHDVRKSTIKEEETTRDITEIAKAISDLGKIIKNKK